MNQTETNDPQDERPFVLEYLQAVTAHLAAQRVEQSWIRTLTGQDPLFNFLISIPITETDRKTYYGDTLRAATLDSMPFKFEQRIIFSPISYERNRKKSDFDEMLDDMTNEELRQYFLNYFEK